MEQIKKPFKSSTPAYLIIKTLILGVLLLVFYFKILPALTQVVSEASLVSAEKIRNQFFLIMIGYFIFIFFINFYFWNIRAQERQIQKHLELNPDDFINREKLKQIEVRKNRSTTMLEFISTLVFGAIIGFVVYTIFSPIYSLNVF